MSGYELIDIHCHVLPGIDDGAADFEESQRMLCMAAEDGISRIIVTPHFKSRRTSADKEMVQKLVMQLQEWLLFEKIPIRLYTGNEILYRHKIDNLLEENKCCSMADSFYVLVEFSPKDDYHYIKSGVQEILMAGYYPLIAHIERYDCLYHHTEYVEELVEMGAYTQVNAASIEGKLGYFAKRKVLKWIEEGLVHIVASDTHDTKKRVPGLSKAAAIIEKKCGEDTARELFELHPKRILAHQVMEQTDYSNRQERKEA